MQRHTGTRWKTRRLGDPATCRHTLEVKTHTRAQRGARAALLEAFAVACTTRGRAPRTRALPLARHGLSSMPLPPCRSRPAPCLCRSSFGPRAGRARIM